MRYTDHTDTAKHAVLIKNEREILSCSEDGTVRIFDMQSGDCVYGFFNHRSQDFKHVAVNTKGDRVIAANTNGMLYILHPVVGTGPEDDVYEQAQVVELDLTTSEFEATPRGGSPKSKTCTLL